MGSAARAERGLIDGCFADDATHAELNSVVGEL
jgi:hypothetical protein